MTPDFEVVYVRASCVKSGIVTTRTYVACLLTQFVWEVMYCAIIVVGHIPLRLKRKKNEK